MILFLSRRDRQITETVQDHGRRSAGLQHADPETDPQTTVSKSYTYTT